MTSPPAPPAPPATPIDLSTWPRRQHFEHYRSAVPCTYAVTVELDATAFVEALRDSTRKTYIAQVWALATAVNQHDEFRMCLTPEGTPATWPVVHPSFTVFNAAQETFASVWAPYEPSFAQFHDAAATLLTEHRTATEMFPQGPPPANSFDVSSLPWTPFTGFSLAVQQGFDHMAPIFTLGRYVEREGVLRLPVALQVHHAAADGFHAARLLETVQGLLLEPRWVG